MPEGVANVDLFVGTGRNTGTFPLFVGGLMMMMPYSESVDEFRRLCITRACSISRSAHEVKFTMRTDSHRTDRSVVVFDARPAVYLHAVGRDEPNKGPLIGSSIVFSLGAANVLVSPIVFAAGETKVGTVMLVGGGAVTAVGAVLLYLARRTKQSGAGKRFDWPTPAP